MKSKLLRYAALAFSSLSAFASGSAHAQLLPPEQALTDFVNRTSLGRGDVTNWQKSLPTLIGSYITIENGNIKMLGQGTGPAARPTQVDLQNSPVFHSLITSSADVKASVLGMFNLSREKKVVDELTITDLITINDTVFKGDTCIANHPLYFSATTKYWCISAITLSSVVSKKYKKVTRLGSGTYGVVTADGTFEATSDRSGSFLAGSVSVLGPFMNGGPVEPEPSKNLVTDAIDIRGLREKSVTFPSATQTKTGLEGAALSTKP